jgi:DNA-binding IscR family transcriptional regulator
MRHDTKLSGVLHVLLHMIEAGGAVTSERLAAMMATHPVVVRRIMAGLREAGFVASEKGHGGGWRIAADPAAVSLADIYRALGAPALFAMGHRSENPACLVEQAVNASLDQALHEAEAVLLARFAEVSLAELAAEFGARMKARGAPAKDCIGGDGHAA